MKILVCGCSFSSGWGFDDGISDANIWPNIVAKNLDAEVTNLSITGCDNIEIFLNALTAIQNQNFDKIIVQWTSLERIIISPKAEHYTMITEANPCPDLSDSDYRHFYKVFLELNGMQAHWNRFHKLISVLQNYNNVYFVNGLLPWNQKLFDKNTTLEDCAKNKFLSSLLQIESKWTPDLGIQSEWMPEPVWDTIKIQVQTLDLNKWIMLIDSMQSLKVDQISDNDLHPGIQSHQIFANYITKYFLDK
jgi:hypothetical protein